MKKYKIKHIHENVGFYNGTLYFLVDDKLFRVGVGTPNFNDYGEWRLSGFTLSLEKYDPDSNEVELKPYGNFEDIEIDSNDLEFLMQASIVNSMGMNDAEFKNFTKKFGEYDEELRGGRYKGNSLLTIFTDDGDVKLDSKWRKKKNKKPFEKIFYPILDGFRKGFLKE